MADSREIVVACRALEAEIERVQHDSGIVRRVVYIDRGLHNVPEKLREAVQETLDSLTDVDRVLMGYANCGNAMEGVKARDFEIVFPKVDDCISILFNSQEAREAYSSEHRSMFMTEGWMDSEHGIVEEYYTMLDRFGQERADSFTRQMYAHYRTMTYLDTGLYSIDELKDRTKVICDIAELETRTHPVELTYIEQLITGPWTEDRFARIAPHTVVSAWR